MELFSIRIQRTFQLVSTYGGQNPILLPCNSWAVAWMPEAGNSLSYWIL